MPPTGTSRGYGNDPDDNADAVSYEKHDHDHDEEEHAHGHGAAADPNWVDPSDNSIDDVYITTGGRRGNSTPIGGISPTKILDALTPLPHAYKVDLWRIIGAGFWATLVFTPIWYCIYFGYRDTSFDLGLLLGAAISPALDWGTRLIGLGIHFGVGIGIAVTYAYVLLVLRTQSSGGRGTQFGIGLCFAMMTFIFPLFVGILPRFAAMQPTFDMPDMLLQQAGPSNVGYGPFVVALIAHVFYGMIVGGLYRHRVVVRQFDRAVLTA